MNEEQLKAIKSLEVAFKKCAKLKIHFYGMDGDLMAINSKDADTSQIDHRTDSSSSDHLHNSLNAHGIIVNSSRSYKDSGGF